MNLPEWKQASMGCLSAILFGMVQPVYAFVMGSMISVYFLPEHDEISKKKKNIYALFHCIGCVLLPSKYQPTLQFCSHGKTLDQAGEEDDVFKDTDF